MTLAQLVSDGGPGAHRIGERYMSHESDDASTEIELPGPTIYTPGTKIITPSKLQIRIPLSPEYEHEIRTLPYTLLP